jgi:integrase
MAQTVGKLTALKISRTLEPGMYADGAGLYLQVTGSGAKSWIFRYQRDGHERQMGLGSLLVVSLADARKKAADARAWKAEGLDPIQARDAARAAKSDVTFKECAVAYIDSNKAGWGEGHYYQWNANFESYVYPHIGALPARSVDTDMVLQVLEPIWTEYPETAGRIRGRIEVVLDWAKVKNYRAGENPARWRGHLDKLLPSKSKVHKVEHFAAMPYKDIPEFMAKLRKRTNVTARALEFCILTATRSNETIGAHCNEFDFDEPMWKIPAERMKMDRDHRVPLVGRALEIAKTGADGLLFCGRTERGTLNDDGLLNFLKRRMKVQLTVHGFRSSFDDWASETTDHAPHIIDMALAHKIGDDTKEAYRRGDLFAKRRQLMADWDAFCLGVQPAAQSESASSAI